MNWSRVESRIHRLLRSQKKARVGLVVKDLGSGHEIAYNADIRFASASLVKIPVAVGLFNAIENGGIERNARPLFEERHRIGGSGILRKKRSGTRHDLDELLSLMLARSDNTATNILTELVGMERITRMCREYGWSQTNMEREVMRLDLRSKGIENWTSPHDMAKILEGLYRGKVVSPRSSRELLAFMRDPPIADRLPRKLPRSVSVVHKTGLIYDNTHDVGILYLPGGRTVLVAALVDNIGSRYRKGKQVIANIARIIYEEAVTSNKTPVSRSEHGPA